MALKTRIALAGVAAAALATLVGGTTAFAAPAQHLPWNYPDSVTGGQPISVASVRSCPAPPTPGDQVLVQINLAFTGGGSGQILSANPDGSWSGQVTFNLVGAPSSGTISATCEDFTGITGIPYANYQAHSVAISS